MIASATSFSSSTVADSVGTGARTCTTPFIALPGKAVQRAVVRPVADRIERVRESSGRDNARIPDLRPGVGVAGRAMRRALPNPTDGVALRDRDPARIEAQTWTDSDGDGRGQRGGGGQKENAERARKM